MGQRLITVLYYFLNILSCVLVSFLLTAWGFGMCFIVYKAHSALNLSNGLLHFLLVLYPAINATHSGIVLLKLKKGRSLFITTWLMSSPVLGFLAYMYFVTDSIANPTKILLLYACIFFISAVANSKKQLPKTNNSL